MLAKTPSIYIDDRGILRSQVSEEQVEAVLGPYVDRIRAKLAEQDAFNRQAALSKARAHFNHLAASKKAAHVTGLVGTMIESDHCTQYLLMEWGDRTRSWCKSTELVVVP